MDTYSVDTASGPVWSGRRDSSDDDWMEVSAEIKSAGPGPRAVGKTEPRAMTLSASALEALVADIEEDVKDKSANLLKMDMGFFVERMLLYIDEIMASPGGWSKNMRFIEEGPLREWRRRIYTASPAAYDEYVHEPYEDQIKMLKAQHRDKTTTGSMPDALKMQHRKKKLRELEDIHGYKVDICLGCGKLKL